MWIMHLAAVSSLLFPVWPASTTVAADPCGYLTETRVVPCFTDPTASDESSSRIFQSLGALTDSANSGDTIRIMMYDWQTGATYPENLAQQVVAAHNRGVDVKLVLDEQTDEGIVSTFTDAGIPLVVCDDWESSDEAPDDRPENCLMWDNPDYYPPDSDLPMNHTKMWLFTIDGVRHVVAGSSNLGEWDYANAWNDMVRIRNDEKLYGFLSGWWDRVWANDWDGWTTDADRESDGDSASGVDLPEHAYLYPRVSDDPIVSNLEKLTGCSSDGDGDGDWDKRVYIAISKWNTDQRTEIVDELIRLDDAGCRIRLLVDWSFDPAWVDSLRSQISGSSTDTSQVRWACRLHHKSMILDGEYDGVYRELVVTGSNVWATGSQLYSSELNLRIGGEDEQTDDGAVRAYIDHYANLWENFARTEVEPPDTCPH